MFFKKNIRKNGVTNKTYITYKLVESVRNKNGTGHNHIYLASIGNLDDFDENEKKELKCYLEFHIKGKIGLFGTENFSEKIREKGNKVLESYQEMQQIKKERNKVHEKKGEQYQSINMNSIQSKDRKTIGLEYICYEIAQEIGLQDIFQELGFTKKQQAIACILVINRCISPGSEAHACKRTKEISAIGELMGIEASMNRKIIYKILKALNTHHELIEKRLIENEQQYGSDDAIVLYDLTNTYFEGKMEKNTVAKYGRSKEKRSDAKLVTLGLLVNKDGFPKYSKVYDGNQSEPITFQDIMNDLQQRYKANLFQRKPLVVMDAGIATKDNIEELKTAGYKYVVVTRGNVQGEVEGDYELTKTMKSISGYVTNTISIRRNKTEDELYLECKSKKKNQKETSIQEKLEKLMEKKLEKLQTSIEKGTIKKAETIHKKIGNIMGSYARVSQYYNIRYNEKDNKLIREKDKEKETKYKKKRERYILRTNYTQANNKEIRDIYNTIRKVEDSFKTMKTDLRLRPIYHQQEVYTRAHIFLTVLAYHIVNIILYKLNKQGKYMRRSSLLEDMSTRTIGTLSYQGANGKKGSIRIIDTPNVKQEEICKLLGLNPKIRENRKIY